MRKLQCRVCGFKAHDLAEHVRQAHNLDPADYESQYNHKIKGQMATDGWRKKDVVYPPEGAIDEVEKLSPRKPAVKIDPDLFLPDLKLKDEIIKCLEDGDNIILVGPKGCGKTTLIKKLAEEMLTDKQKLFRTKFFPDMTPPDLVGHPIITPERLIGYSYGILPRAMNPKQCGLEDIEDGWLHIDELDAGSPRIHFTLFGVLEDDRNLYIHDVTEEITATKNFRIIATANTKGYDDTGRYIRGIQDAAFQDRWTIFEVDYTPHEKQLLMEKIGVDEDLADKMMALTKDVRAGAEEGEINTTLSTRGLFRWGQKILRFGLEIGTQIALLNPLQEQDKETYTGLVDRHLDITFETV